MNQKNELFEFESKFKFLYDIKVNDVPIYTVFRDGVLSILQNGEIAESSVNQSKKGRIYPKRILVGLIKLRKFRKAKSLIFTSSVYRRDRGRNLAAEWLMDKYPDAVVFEWPSRNDVFDKTYFKDKLRRKYCPIDFYPLVYKLYLMFHKKEYAVQGCQCRNKLKKFFEQSQADINENEKKAIDYLMDKLPDSYANTVISQKIFAKMFKKYHNIEYAIDFWGSARENIIPVLNGDFKSVELQHGIITSTHPGYIYPSFVEKSDKRFFGRTLLVYGDKTKELLTENSIFSEEQVEVIGNPRIQKFKSEFKFESKKRKLILFASQPYEQDGTGVNYYAEIIEYLKQVDNLIKSDLFWNKFELGVKLHPREDNEAAKLFRDAIPDIKIFDSASQLFDLLSESFVQLTVSSTTLYEAAQFDTPTVNIKYGNLKPVDIYGFDTLYIDKPLDIFETLNKIKDEDKYEKYLKYLQIRTQLYM